MKYLLNSAVITEVGTYKYTLISVDYAREWYRKGHVISTIGYLETAQVLSELLGAEIAVNRVTIKMQPGDEALVFRLVLPPGHPRIDPSDKGNIAKVISEKYWELGLLQRVE